MDNLRNNFNVSRSLELAMYLSTHANQGVGRARVVNHLLTWLPGSDFAEMFENAKVYDLCMSNIVSLAAQEATTSEFDPDRKIPLQPRLRHRLAFVFHICQHTQRQVTFADLKQLWLALHRGHTASAVDIFYDWLHRTVLVPNILQEGAAEQVIDRVSRPASDFV